MLNLKEIKIEDLWDITEADCKWLESIGIFWPKIEHTSESGIEYSVDLATISWADVYIEVKNPFGDWNFVLKNSNRGQVLALLISLSDQCSQIKWIMNKIKCSRETGGCLKQHV